MRSLQEVQSRANDVGIQFVLAELDLALSLLDTADESVARDHRQRCCNEAKMQHDTVLILLQRLAVNDSQGVAIRSTLDLIASRLGRLGVSAGVAR